MPDCSYEIALFWFEINPGLQILIFYGRKEREPTTVSTVCFYELRFFHLKTDHSQYSENHTCQTKYQCLSAAEYTIAATWASICIC